MAKTHESVGQHQKLSIFEEFHACRATFEPVTSGHYSLLEEAHADEANLKKNV